MDFDGYFIVIRQSEDENLYPISNNVYNFTSCLSPIVWNAMYIARVDMNYNNERYICNNAESTVSGCYLPDPVITFSSSTITNTSIDLYFNIPNFNCLMPSYCNRNVYEVLLRENNTDNTINITYNNNIIGDIFIESERDLCKLTYNKLFPGKLYCIYLYSKNIIGKSIKGNEYCFNSSYICIY